MSHPSARFITFMHSVEPLLASSTTWGRYVPTNTRLWRWWHLCMTAVDVDEGMRYMRHKIFGSFDQHKLSVVKCIRSWLRESNIGCWTSRMQHLLCLYHLSSQLYDKYCNSARYDAFLQEGLLCAFSITHRRCACCAYYAVQHTTPLMLEPPLTTVDNATTSQIHSAALFDKNHERHDCQYFWLKRLGTDALCPVCTPSVVPRSFHPQSAC